MSERKCWMCPSEDIAYVDVLNMAWCDSCYEGVYLKGF